MAYRGASRQEFLKVMQRHTATTCIAPSSLRNQGPGVLVAARTRLSKISLARIPHSSAVRFGAWLDRETEKILDQLPIRERPWGVARKALNLFLRDALCNQYLARTYGLNEVQQWLEIPLDSIVARTIRSKSLPGTLPAWPGLKHLQREVSDDYQAVAQDMAAERRMARVHLDMYLWLDGR